MRPLRPFALTGVMLVSCVADDNPDDDIPVRGPDFEVRYQTEYADLATGFTQPVCRGTLDDIDRHMEAVAEHLDIDMQRRITVFWYNQDATGAFADNSEICLWCPFCIGACYGNGVVHTRLRHLHHELTHGVVTPAWSHSVPLFGEGIANAFGRQRGGYGNVSTIYSLRTITKPSEVAGSGDRGSGHFSLWLVDRFGPAKFRAMFEHLDIESSSNEVFAAVEDVYGMPFEELDAEYYATAPTIYPLPGLCDGLLHVPWTQDRWELSLTADCDTPHTFGPRDDGTMSVIVTIDIPPEFEGVPLASWIPSGASAEVWPCIEEPLYDADPEIVHGNGISKFGGPTTFRSARRHRIELPVEEPGEVYLRLCPDNGKFPGAYPADAVDPKNCLGD